MTFAGFDPKDSHLIIAIFFEAHNAPKFDLKAYRAASLELASELNEALNIIKILRMKIEGLQTEIKMMQEEMHFKVS